MHSRWKPIIFCSSIPPERESMRKKWLVMHVEYPFNLPFPSLPGSFAIFPFFLSVTHAEWHDKRDKLNDAHIFFFFLDNSILGILKKEGRVAKYNWLHYISIQTLLAKHTEKNKQTCSYIFRETSITPFVLAKHLFL